jgi:hypothetical protein
MSMDRILMAGALGLLLAACGSYESEDDSDILDAEIVQPAAQAATTAAMQPDAHVDQPTVVIAADAVAVGDVLGAEGAVTADKAAYAVGGTVYASVPVGGYPANAEVAIYWVAENGTSVKEERKPIAAGAKFMSFELSAADGMTAGRYTVQIDIGDIPVGMADFVVR